MSRLQKRDIPAEVLAASPHRDQTVLLSMGSKAHTNALPPIETTMLLITHLVKTSQYERALEMLASEPSTPQIRNARGVCLLRLGRYELALQLFRGLMLDAGGNWAREDLPTVYFTNLATAMLLAGQPGDCLSLLNELDKESHPTVIALRRELHRWQSTLTFSERLNWWFGRLDPPHCRIAIHFLPGEFDSEEKTSQLVRDQEISNQAFPVLGMG